jgi:hypothetical protein
VYKKKLKRKKKEKEECFANQKEWEDSPWCNLPKIRKLHGARKSVAASENSLRPRKLVVLNAFLCSLATAPENSLDDTKKTPSAEFCSKSKFSPRGNSGFISNSRGIVKKDLFILVRQAAKQYPCLASPTPPSGWQAQGVECK